MAVSREQQEGIIWVTRFAVKEAANHNKTLRCTSEQYSACTSTDESPNTTIPFIPKYNPPTTEQIHQRLATLSYQCILAAKLRFSEVMDTDRWKYADRSSLVRSSTDIVREEMNVSSTTAADLILDLNSSGLVLSFANRSELGRTTSQLIDRMWVSALNSGGGNSS